MSAQNKTQKWNWIFDWSGTLVDDMALVLCATNHVMRHYGKPEWQRDDFRREFRLPYEDFYHDCLPGVALEELEVHFREGFARSQKLVPILPHAIEFLDFLKAEGHSMVVLTSMCEVAFAEQLVDLGMGDYFEATYAGVLDKRDRIGGILDHHGWDRDGTIFVGDMTHDVETAHHGGVRSAAVLTGYNHRELLESVSPSVICDDLGSLKVLLESGEIFENVIGGCE